MAKEPKVWTRLEVRQTGFLQEKYKLTVKLNHLLGELATIQGVRAPCISALYHHGFKRLEREIILAQEELQLVAELLS